MGEEIGLIAVSAHYTHRLGMTHRMHDRDAKYLNCNINLLLQIIVIKLLFYSDTTPGSPNVPVRPTGRQRREKKMPLVAAFSVIVRLS